MSEIVKSEYNALDEQGNYKTHFFKTSADQVVGLGRMKSFSYSVGDVAYSDTNNKVALKCITGGTTSNAELDISTNNIGDTVTDGTVVWQVCNRTSDVTSVNGKTGDVVVDLPVGHMYWSVEPNVPAGRLPAMGATYNRALYADLWAWANEVGLVKTESEWQAIASANDGNCAYYSNGDGSTTFRVPAIKCWVKGASGIEEVGSYLQAGLPNIQGKFTHIMGDGVTYSFSSSSTIEGAFTKANLGTRRLFTNSSGSYPAFDLAFDASNSNAIYGNSDTVQPPSLVGMWLIVAFGVAHNVGEADVANVMQAIEQVQTSVGTLEQGVGTLEQGVGTAIDYIVDSWRNGAEWYEVYKSGKVRQGGEFNGSIGPNATSSAISLNHPFGDTNYFIIATNRMTGFFGAPLTIPNDSKTNTSFKLYQYSGNNTLTGARWYAEGQGV